MVADLKKESGKQCVVTFIIFKLLMNRLKPMSYWYIMSSLPNIYRFKGIKKFNLLKNENKIANLYSEANSYSLIRNHIALM